MPSVRDAIEAARLSPERLQALRDTGLLDSAETQALDRLSRLAAKLLGVPVAFLSLVDAERDFYASHSGLTGEIANTREVRGTTFCHLGLVSGGPVAIEDTHSDPLHRAVPTVDSMGIGAYLGIPIRIGGEVIGAMCAVDFKPRQWSDNDREILQGIADAAHQEIRLLAAMGEGVRRADVADAALRAAQVAERASRQVLNAVSHDLRTPLSSLVLALAAMEPALHEQRALKAMEIAKRQAAHMKTRLDDLLDDARLAEGTLRLSRNSVQISDLLLGLTDDFTAAAQAAGISLEVSLPEPVPAANIDRARMEQVFANLLSNSLKFTPRGGRLTISARHRGDDLEFEVADTGRGIDPAVVDRMFEPYWQGDPQSAVGVGLGLHIARSLVELHGGRISARSALGEGTTFRINIPLAAGAAAPAE